MAQHSLPGRTLIVSRHLVRQGHARARRRPPRGVSLEDSPQITGTYAAPNNVALGYSGMPSVLTSVAAHAVLTGEAPATATADLVRARIHVYRDDIAVRHHLRAAIEVLYTPPQ
jgi:hypothetical protein